MSEAIISRFGGGSDAEISNETKQSLGLPNNATIDDVISALTYKDANYATILVTVTNPDGSPAADSQVVMRDDAGVNYSYNCNAAGKCMFKTNAGKANFVNDEIYVDVVSETKAVDAVVGSVQSISFTRNFHNYSDKVKLSSGNYQFTDRLNNFWAYVVGGGGSSSTYSVRNCGIGFRNNGSWWKQSGESVSDCYNGGNGYANSILINHINGTIYKSILGAGGSAPSDSNSKSGSTSSRTSSINRVNLDMISGRTGGTSSFGGIVSAPGGSGGTDDNSYKQNNVQNEYGGASGKGASYSVTGSCSAWANGRGASATLYASTYGRAGSQGNVFITNFNYRT